MHRLLGLRAGQDAMLLEGHVEAFPSEGSMSRQPHQTLAQRWARHVKAGPNCWNWTGAMDGDGYGVLSLRSLGRKMGRAPRIAWELFVGPIPRGMLVCHHCDNPGCVNPAHLFVGTVRDNTLDAVRKGRMKPPVLPRQTHCQRGHEFSAANTYHYRGKRRCRQCMRACQARYLARTT